jgi:mono/diheme cytochrome c family protein
MKIQRRWRAAGVLLLLPALACSRQRRASGPAVSAPPRPDASYELRRGRGVYVSYCQTCHGETGAGDGFNAFNLDPRPRDLSDPAFQKTKTDAEFADTIRRGGAGVGMSALMPPWGHTLSARQVEAVTLYLRSMQKQAASPGGAKPAGMK